MIAGALDSQLEQIASALDNKEEQQARAALDALQTNLIDTLDIPLDIFRNTRVLFLCLD
jgi:hypothetical protein